TSTILWLNRSAAAGRQAMARARQNFAIAEGNPAEVTGARAEPAFSETRISPIFQLFLRALPGFSAHAFGEDAAPSGAGRDRRAMVILSVEFSLDPFSGKAYYVLAPPGSRRRRGNPRAGARLAPSPGQPLL